VATNITTVAANVFWLLLLQLGLIIAMGCLRSSVGCVVQVSAVAAVTFNGLVLVRF
jgi:hypothetical protein